MEIDPRGPRFGALITMVVFAVVLITGNVWLLAAQAVVFAAGAILGLRHSPYGLLYKWLVRPRLGPPDELEAEAPPRFAQAVGLAISIIGIIGFAAGLRPLGLVAAGLGLVAAVLNGVFGLCLGCEMYLMIRRTWPAQAERRPKLTQPSNCSTSRSSPRVLADTEEDLSMSRSDVLVDAEWVEAHRDDPGVVLVEVDEDTSAYDKGHIRGAVKIDWKKDLQDPVRRDFVDREGFAALLSERGISNDDTVILYGGNNNWFAAYAYWYFKLYGHKNVKLLDGGRKKWELDSRELVTEVPARAATSYTAQEQDSSIRAFRDEVINAIGNKNLIDVRSPDEFAGRLLAPAHLPQEQAQRGGHVPTAKNVPWSKAAEDDGTFKSDDALRTLYSEAGVDFGTDTIAYCRIGERSAHTWFVMHELLGQPNVKNYDGSWTEYGSLVGVPIKLGDES